MELMAARYCENWPKRLVNNFTKKSTALTVTWCRENKLSKVGIFTAIRLSYYNTLVDKKSTALTAARCRENWPN